jgi:hypothetical protein
MKQPIQIHDQVYHHHATMLLHDPERAHPVVPEHRLYAWHGRSVFPDSNFKQREVWVSILAT